ncbi:MAG: cytidine deaminase, partial [Gemmatimonadales bacterium]
MTLELDDNWMPLRDAAIAVMNMAHAPYSQFRVGAALEATDGRLFVGCNIENASYPVTMCAERVALGSAVAAGAVEFRRLYLCAESRDPAPPCGMCRQALTEFALDDLAHFERRHVRKSCGMAVVRSAAGQIPAGPATAGRTRPVKRLFLLASVILAAGSCTEDSLVGVDPDTVPGQSQETLELSIDVGDLPIWMDTTYVGFAVPLTSGIQLVASDSSLTSRLLGRFPTLPDSIFVDSARVRIDSMVSA